MTTRRSAEGEARHTIQVVARQTGVSPDALRVWERRYGAVAPARSAGRQRQYTDEELHRLRLLGRLTRAGHRIGQVAQLSVSELEELVKSDEDARASLAAAPAGPSDAASSFLDEVLVATEALDSRALDALLGRALATLGAELHLDGVLLPALRIVGERWHAGELTPAHEHLLTIHLRAQLHRILVACTPRDARLDVVVATPSGEHHELAAMAAAVAAASAGCRVTYLGADVPAGDIVAAVETRGARALALSLVRRGAGVEMARQLEALARGLPEGVRCFAGGGAVEEHAAALRRLGARVVADLPAWREELRRLVHALP